MATKKPRVSTKRAKPSADPFPFGANLIKPRKSRPPRNKSARFWAGMHGSGGS